MDNAKTNTIFMNSEKSKTSVPRRLLLNLIDNIDLRRKDKYIALSNLTIYYTWENIKRLGKNYKFKMSAPTWNEEFELPDASYSISDIQDYFEYVLKKHGEKTANPSIRIYINTMQNQIMSNQIKIITGCYLELLTPETITWKYKSKISKNENGENVPDLEITEVVLIHCSVVNNKSQKNSRVLYTIVPNKSLGQLLDIPPENSIFLETFDSESSYIEV